MNLVPFVPMIAGGLLIGASASLLLLSNGRVAGISGLYDRALRDRSDVTAKLFLTGLLVSPWFALAAGLHLQSVAAAPASWLKLIGAGLLVGVGTWLGSGCTSGHGVCGMANLSLRSFTATLIFMAVAALVVALGFGGVL